MILPSAGTTDWLHIYAAYDLGVSAQVQMLKEIMLPYLTPAIIAGCFMAFHPLPDDFTDLF